MTQSNRSSRARRLDSIQHRSIKRAYTVHPPPPYANDYAYLLGFCDGGPAAASPRFLAAVVAAGPDASVAFKSGGTEELYRSATDLDVGNSLLFHLSFRSNRGPDGNSCSALQRKRLRNGGGLADSVVGLVVHLNLLVCKKFFVLDQHMHVVDHTAEVLFDGAASDICIGEVGRGAQVP